MNLGVLPLLLAFGGAGWLLWRMARGQGADKGNVTLLKVVAFLLVAAALFAAKLWPLAFMILVAAAAVTGIETWRDRIIRADQARDATPPAAKTGMSLTEAASVLGIPEGASVEDVKAAHRKLIGQLHPDKGGTDYFAAKINDARDVLLGAIEGAPAPKA